MCLSISISISFFIKKVTSNLFSISLVALSTRLTFGFLENIEPNHSKKPVEISAVFLLVQHAPKKFLKGFDFLSSRLEGSEVDRVGTFEFCFLRTLEDPFPVSVVIRSIEICEVSKFSGGGTGLHYSSSPFA